MNSYSLWIHTWTRSAMLKATGPNPSRESKSKCSNGTQHTGRGTETRMQAGRGRGGFWQVKCYSRSLLQADSPTGSTINRMWCQGRPIRSWKAVRHWHCNHWHDTWATLRNSSQGRPWGLGREVNGYSHRMFCNSMRMSVDLPDIDIARCKLQNILCECQWTSRPTGRARSSGCYSLSIGIIIPWLYHDSHGMICRFSDHQLEALSRVTRTIIPGHGPARDGAGWRPGAQ